MTRYPAVVEEQTDIISEVCLYKTDAKEAFFEIPNIARGGNHQTYPPKNHLSKNLWDLSEKYTFNSNQDPRLPTNHHHTGKPCEKLCSASEHLSIFINIICQYKYFLYNLILKIGVHQTRTYNMQGKQFKLKGIHGFSHSHKTTDEIKCIWHSQRGVSRVIHLKMQCSVISSNTYWKQPSILFVKSLYSV